MLPRTPLGGRAIRARTAACGIRHSRGVLHAIDIFISATLQGPPAAEGKPENLAQSNKHKLLIIMVLTRLSHNKLTSYQALSARAEFFLIVQGTLPSLTQAAGRPNSSQDNLGDPRQGAERLAALLSGPATLRT
jgi:hypothetical protein